MASSSPRRKELLAKILPNFEIIPATAPEVSSATEPCMVVAELAEHKALEVWSRNRDALVIGCDTVVDLDGKILGKPCDAADAKRMLFALSGKTHLVHTGVCILCGDKKQVFCETSRITFRELSSEEIDSYIASGGSEGKAGAYGIQDCDFVKSYHGSFDNVVGLPTERLKQCLADKF